MSLTVRKYRRYRKYGFNPLVKSSRRQYPSIKRNSHHRLRQNNKFRDQLAALNFSSFRHHRNENTLAATLRNGKFYIESHLAEFDRDPLSWQSKRAKLQNEILKQKKDQKKGNEYGPLASIKKGFFEKDVLLMAWKMLKRRGSLQPFQGHRDRRALYKRESVF